MHMRFVFNKYPYLDKCNFKVYKTLPTTLDSH